jgi:hypothetical protein
VVIREPPEEILGMEGQLLEKGIILKVPMLDMQELMHQYRPKKSASTERKLMPPL